MENVRKNQVIDVLMPNDVMVSAVVLDRWRERKVGAYDRDDSCYGYLCYAQNRLFVAVDDDLMALLLLDYVVCDYCVIPEADELLDKELN